MKLYTIVCLLATTTSLLGCNSGTVSECLIGDAIDPTSGVQKQNGPPEIPGTAQMATVIGPILVDQSKWGPENENQPFSWPGRAVQREATFPQNPNEQLIYEVRLPEKSALYKVHVWVDPVEGHVGVPASRAQSMVWTHNGGFGESEPIATVITLGDSVVNYEQRYLLTMTFDEPYVMKADTRVFIYVFGEWGNNYLPGLTVDTPEIVYSAP